MIFADSYKWSNLANQPRLGAAAGVEASFPAVSGHLFVIPGWTGNPISGQMPDQVGHDGKGKAGHDSEGSTRIAVKPEWFMMVSSYIGK